MREDLMQELRRVTEEEERLLAGGQVDKSLYTSGSAFLITTDGNGRSRWVRHPDLNGEVRAKRRTKNRFLIAKTTW